VHGWTWQRALAASAATLVVPVAISVLLAL
jgi:hypothetical protein